MPASRRTRKLARNLNESRAVANRALAHSVRLSPREAELAKRAIEARLAKMEQKLAASRARKPSKAVRLATNPRLAYRAGRIGVKKTALALRQSRVPSKLEPALEPARVLPARRRKKAA
ncbi:MAG: hypothetical protein JW772_01425 [Candidatus Diapherotrites archaeon]|nr:hypothetical protein [Candidatus Diapherotrites archaeon]